VTAKHHIHKCLTCSGQITPDQEEEMVPGTVLRYRHGREADCMAELRGDTSAGLRAARRGGHRANLPGLDDMEKW